MEEKKISTIAFKPVAETEKCFIDESISTKAVYKKGSMLRGERFSFQVAYQDMKALPDRIIAHIRIESDIKDWVSMQRVEDVSVRYPCSTTCEDRNFLRREPGLYPDILHPITEKNRVFVTNALQSVWVDIRVPEDAEAGEYKIKFVLYNAEPKGETEEVLGTCEFTAVVIPATLPKQKLIVTQWFYCDCLASYYNVEMFSERHWEIIENYIVTAVDNGINMILTPVFTPALDTQVGGERPTNQLVRVTRENGKWSFDFELLHRWVEMCKRCGVEYYEISHLFTQWGAEHAPKVMATVDGEYKKVFGWETDAGADEYTGFLRELIPQLIEVLRQHGVDKNTVFHISDEPGGWMLESYKKAKSTVEDVLDGQMVIDALSDYSFYEQGILKNPVVSTDHVGPYLENNVKDLWVYYCCCQVNGVSNRMIAMPTARNRIIATQFYKYKIAGFLQWGYNFYYTQHSCEACNPYACTDGGFWVPAGDTFSVYPAIDGTAYESIHLLGFTAALYDLRAMELAESLCGREAVMAAIEDGIEPITFASFPHEQEYILEMRERINKLIADNI
ncbi:MAG: DUF4091 domain-containing protein [Clostridia bacterium]|nr:DUF4091 domain-containing protein [Clostridia bacterium]